jgi:Flp pilus assembly protein TadG
MAAMNATMMRRLRSERGAELIEFALVFPVLLLVVLGIVDFGFLFQRMEVVTNAAREGARMAVLPAYSSTDVRNRVCAYVQNGGVPVTTCSAPGGGGNPVIDVTTVSIPVAAGLTPMSGKRVQVTYTHNYIFIGPIASWFGGAFTSVPINGIAIMRDEVQPAAGP